VRDASVGPQVLIGNLMYNPGRSVRVLYRRDWSEEAGKWRSAYGDTVEENRVADPRFGNPEQGDFSLLPDSPAIEAGRLIEVPGLIFSGTSVNIGARQSSTAGQAGWSVAR
jgi:hypothetical protein